MVHWSAALAWFVVGLIIGLWKAMRLLLVLSDMRPVRMALHRYLLQTARPDELEEIAGELERGQRGDATDPFE